MSARWLVAGCGYVGTALVSQELQQGHEVVAVGRSLRSRMSDNPGLHVVEADLAERESLPESLPASPWASVFLVSPGLREPQQQQSYLRALENWNHWCSHLEIPFRILASSSGIYEQNDGGWVDESSALEISSERTLALHRAEERFWETLSVDAVGVVLRIGGIYGPDRHRFFQAAASAETDAWLNLIYQEDLVGALQSCAQVMREKRKEVEGTYNLTDGAPVLRSELAGWLAQQQPAHVGTPAPQEMRRSRGQANRRIAVQHFVDTFLWTPRFANYQSGYRQILSSMQD